MSLAKLKKDELNALAESHNLSLDPDWTKAEMIEALEAEGVEANDAEYSHADGKHLTKADRQKRLFARTDSKPGEATLFRSKAERQTVLIARTDRTK